jgi:hypothetical protein
MAQEKSDYHWIMGYPPNTPEEFYGGVDFSFNSNQVSPNYFHTQSFCNENACLSTPSGRLLAYSEGCRLYNADHEIIVNGDSLAFGDAWLSYCEEGGYPGTQHHLLLPWPGDSSKAILLYLKYTDNYLSTPLYFSEIVFDDQNPLGRVIKKDEFVINPGLTALLTGTKHANGRDWWIVLPEGETNRFFTFLLDSTGISLISTQALGDPVGPRAHSSQAIFTPDGKKYIRFNPWNGLDIFDFDRCTGQLSNPIESGPLSDPVLPVGGVACSVDARYMYVSNRLFLYQYDLHQADILSSRVLVGTYDGYADPFATTFYQMLLAPDGKIYMFSSNGVKSLHVIHHPERKGLLCDLRQHDIKLPAHNSVGSPTMPYFRLGPSDGSLCDTLGINNLPIAYFKYTADTIDHKVLELTNLSYFEPETFHWDFGNGQTSSLERPYYITYTADGIYTICLTVTNAYGQDTYCQTVKISDGITSISPASPYENRVFPNPFDDAIYLTHSRYTDPYRFYLYAADGKLMKQELITSPDYAIDVSNFPPGIYIYTIAGKGEELQRGKLLKVE